MTWDLLYIGITVFWVDIVRNTFIDFVDFYSLIFQAKGVLWLPVSVLRPSVRPSVWKLYLVRTITRHRFRLESQIFYQKMHSVILALVYKKRGHWPGPSRSFWPFWLRILRNLACLHNNLGNGCELKSQNVHQICIFRFSWLVLNTGVINLDLQGHLAISSQDSKNGVHRRSCIHIQRVLHVPTWCYWCSYISEAHSIIRKDS